PGLRAAELGCRPRPDRARRPEGEPALRAARRGLAVPGPAAAAQDSTVVNRSPFARRSLRLRPANGLRTTVFRNRTRAAPQLHGEVQRTRKLAVPWTVSL